jgi:hypothetical protein
MKVRPPKENQLPRKRVLDIVLVFEVLLGLGFM